MGNLRPGIGVEIKPGCVDVLVYGPPNDSALSVAVHPAALRAPKSPHTQLVATVDRGVMWAGAMGEDQLLPEGAANTEVRRLLAVRILIGDRLWRIVRPGPLLRPSVRGQLSTIYMSDLNRPWVVVGSLESGDHLAVPLNEAKNVQWFTPVVSAKEINMPGRKESMLELAHLWSLPRSVGVFGSVASTATERLTEVVAEYFEMDLRQWDRARPFASPVGRSAQTAWWALASFTPHRPGLTWSPSFAGEGMSVKSVQSQIASIHREIESLQRRQSDKKKRIADHASRIASIRRSITQNTSLSMMQSKTRDIERLEQDIANLQKDDAQLQRQIADKTERLHRFQQDLYREQEREQQRFRDALESQARADRALQVRALDAVRAPGAPGAVAEYDAFISHASEDKEALVRPLAEALRDAGRTIWFDEFALQVGDSLRRSIDQGLVKSRFGIVVLSPDFFAKNWPQYELDGLVAKEVAGGKVILPIWHKVSKDEVLRYSPTLADRVALNTATLTVKELAARLGEAMGPT